MKFNETSYSLKIKTPTVVNIELTELCNVKCKHCYNPWRDESMGINELDLIKIQKQTLLKQKCFRHLIKNIVMDMNIQNPPLFDHILYKPHSLFFLSNQGYLEYQQTLYIQDNILYKTWKD